MRFPRLRIWLLMLLVALAALGSFALVLWTQSRQYSELAIVHEKQAATLAAAIKRAKFLISLSLDHPKHNLQLLSLRRQLRRLTDADDTRVNDRGQEAIEGAEAEKIAQMELANIEQAKRTAESEYGALERVLLIEFDRVRTYRRAARYPWLGAPRVEEK
jgi:hypothetical protein